MLIAFASEGIWRLARHISVIAHEGAHAAAAWSMGGSVTGVSLKSDATGVTATLGLGGLGWLITCFVGYLGPSVCGLAAASLIALRSYRGGTVAGRNLSHYHAVLDSQFIRWHLSDLEWWASLPCSALRERGTPDHCCLYSQLVYALVWSPLGPYARRQCRRCRNPA